MQLCKIRFSHDSSFVVVFTDRNLKIFDLRKQAVEQDDGTMEIEYSVEFDMNRPAYDHILEAFIDESDELDSWVVLSSKEFNTIHIIRLRELINDMKIEEQHSHG